MVVVAVFIFIGVGAVGLGDRLGQLGGAGGVGEICAAVSRGVYRRNIALVIVGVGGAGLFAERNVIEIHRVDVAVVGGDYHDAFNGFALVGLLRCDDTGGILPAGIVIVEGHIEVFLGGIGVGTLGNQTEITLAGVLFGGAVGELFHRIGGRGSLGPAGKQISFSGRAIDGNGLAGSLHGSSGAGCRNHRCVGRGSAVGAEIAQAPLGGLIKAAVLQKVYTGGGRACFQLEIIKVGIGISVLQGQKKRSCYRGGSSFSERIGLGGLVSSVVTGINGLSRSVYKDELPL